MDVLSDHEVKKTRKAHVCFGCLKVIPVGSPAHVQVNTDCGKVGSIYTHSYCQKIMQEMWVENDMYGDETFSEGDVTQYLREIDFTGTPEEYVEKEGL